MSPCLLLTVSLILSLSALLSPLQEQAELRLAIGQIEMNVAAAAAAAAPSAASVAALTEMGFPEDDCKRALVAASSDMELAVRFIKLNLTMPVTPALTLTLALDPEFDLASALALL